MKTEKVKDPDRIFREERQLLHEAVKQGVRDAAHRHKELGQPMVIVKNGEIVEVSPDEILAETPVEESPSRRRG